MSDTSSNRSQDRNLSRRAFVANAVSLAAVASLGTGPSVAASAGTPKRASGQFPKGFLWGVATAAHQVEGNNINSDEWVLEHLKPSLFSEPSGDACDHYHRYPEDIKLVAQLGFNTYRFSIEWARIEPEPGYFSKAALDHYRRMLVACRENHLTPMVTFWHFTAPRWFAAQGGWENKDAGDQFVRYCERAAKHFGELPGAATTFNEPNIPMLLRWINLNLGSDGAQGLQGMMRKAAQAVGSDRFGFFLFGDAEKARDTMIPTHHRALAAIKSASGKYPVGVNIAISDDQAVGPDSKRDAKRAEVYGAWLDAASKSDFVGVQTYSRARVGKERDLPPEPGVELTQMGYEFWPEALEQAIRYAAATAKVPVYVTENGVSTEEDTRRIVYITRALAGVQNCLKDNIDVRGYIHWSLMDNYEWVFGYRPKFGLVSVNRETLERTIKPSARFLGHIARHNSLPTTS